MSLLAEKDRPQLALRPAQLFTRHPRKATILAQPGQRADRAGDQGDVIAEVDLAELYACGGNGVAKDQGEVAKWLDTARRGSRSMIGVSSDEYRSIGKASRASAPGPVAWRTASRLLNDRPEKPLREPKVLRN
jgi:hypothetical protein